MQEQLISESAEKWKDEDLGWFPNPKSEYQYTEYSNSILPKFYRPLKTFLRNARNCGSGTIKGARNCGYAQMEKLASAVFHVMSRIEEC